MRGRSQPEDQDAGGTATRNAVERIWVAAGPARARNTTDADVQWADAVSWAALTAVGMAVADLATRKGASEVYRFFLGSAPPASVKPKASKKVAKAEPQFPDAITPPV